MPDVPFVHTFPYIQHLLSYYQIGSTRKQFSYSSFLTRKAKAKISSSKCEKSKAKWEISKSIRIYICFASPFLSRKAILKKQKEETLLNGYVQLYAAKNYQILPKGNNYLNKSEKGFNSVVLIKT